MGGTRRGGSGIRHVVLHPDNNRDFGAIVSFPAVAELLARSSVTCILSKLHVIVVLRMHCRTFRIFSSLYNTTMKQIFILLLMTLPMSSLSAQTSYSNSSLQPVFTGISPSFPGGAEAKKKFISENIRYPEEAKTNRIEGTVELKFIVETNGQLSNFEITNDPGGGLGEEALRIYQLMPAWEPGRLKGESVRIPVTETLNFKLKLQPIKK